jgi:hypothetical protein
MWKFTDEARPEADSKRPPGLIYHQCSHSNDSGSGHGRVFDQTGYQVGFLLTRHFLKGVQN